MMVIPAARRIGRALTGSAEWHELRAGKMTGSRIAAALGLSPWTSPFNLYHEMIGLEPEPLTAPAVEWGTRLESVIIQKYQDEHPGLKVKGRAGVWQNAVREWQVCSPDALVVEPGPHGRRALAVLEIKTSRYADDWGEPGTAEIPVWYRCQALWMLDTLGLRYCHFGVLFSGSDYREYCVEYDEADVAILRRGAVDFLDRVARQDRPDIDGSDSTYQLIRSFHPDIDGSTVELPVGLVKALTVAQEQAREADEELRTVRSTIAEFMGTAKTARNAGKKIADRRARGEGIPYVQLSDITARPTIAEKAAS